MRTEDNRIICDSCGCEISAEEAAYQKPLHIRHTFGYGSKNDLTKVETCFCINCSDAFLPLLISFCKHSGDSIITNYTLCSNLTVEEEEAFYKHLVEEMESAYGKELGSCNQ